jgi:hypothetical protein
MISQSFSLDVSDRSETVLTVRGTELERGSRKAANCTTAKEEEAGNQGIEDYQYPHEGSSE